MEFRILKSEQEMKQGFQVIKELRAHLTWETFVSLTEKARLCDQYTLVGLMEGEECLGVMGFRILYDYVRGQHLYIDDLVTSEAHRSKGYGAQFLKFAEKVAYESGCKVMRLCAVHENHGGKKFYEREGWNNRAVVFQKDVVPPAFAYPPPANV